MSEAKTELGYSVYIHTNKLNGKRYVGITKQIPYKRWCGGHGYQGCTRFYNAIKKYGWKNFEHEILDTGLSKGDAERREIELIRLYDSTNPDKGYNLSSGGGCMNIDVRSDEWKQRISESHIGEKNPVARRIVLVDNKHNYIKEYGCITYAANELGLHISKIQAVCEHKATHTAGYIFMYYSEFVELKNSGVELPPVIVKPYRVPVNQLDLSGNFIQRFDSINDAVKAINGDKKGISQACRGKLKTSGGFKWEFAEGDISDGVCSKYKRVKGDN